MTIQALIINNQPTITFIPDHFLLSTTQYDAVREAITLIMGDDVACYFPHAQHYLLQECYYHQGYEVNFPRKPCEFIEQTPYATHADLHNGFIRVDMADGAYITVWQSGNQYVCAMDDEAHYIGRYSEDITHDHAWFLKYMQQSA